MAHLVVNVRAKPARCGGEVYADSLGGSAREGTDLILCPRKLVLFQ